jgi:hypothetical protein
LRAVEAAAQVSTIVLLIQQVVEDQAVAQAAVLQDLQPELQAIQEWEIVEAVCLIQVLRVVFMEAVVVAEPVQQAKTTCKILTIQVVATMAMVALEHTTL